MFKPMRPVIVGAFGMAVMALTSAAMARSATVHIDAGVLAGTVDGKVESYKGIPYAAPPVGALRWTPPQRPATWVGIRPADQYGLICPQPIKGDGTPNPGGAMGATSEDCLFLNIWAPKGAKNAPVMVWIHGGSNVYGAGSITAYDGSAFVRDGVIVVSINYRLGALGFFAHPALTKAAGPQEPLAAYGVMDQIAALQWVQRNIAKFGGDPDNVTVAGESAGGADILILMASPKAEGLFAKAIVESGGGWSPPLTLASAEQSGTAAALRAGAPADATVEQLRALPVNAIVAKAGNGVGTPIDGRLLTQSPTQAFAHGQEMHVPLLIGTNSYEASLMKAFGMTPGAILAIQPAAVKAAYADLPSDDAKAHAIFTDTLGGGAARWIAGKVADAKPAYLYHFSYVLDSQRPTALGAAHASEIPYVFDSWDKLGAMSVTVAAGPNGLAPLTASDRSVTRLVHACWVGFIKTGTPHCGAGRAWPTYDRTTDVLMEFDTVSGPQTNYRKRQLDVVEAATLPKMASGE